jgi:hypothetical protein
MRWFLALVAFASINGGLAIGSPLKARNPEIVQVKVGGQAKQGIALRSHPEGWRLELSGSTANGTAELVDLTPGTPARTLAVPVNGDELLLDAARFIGGHVYRVQLRRGGVAVESGLVYLYPSPVLKDAPQTKVPQRLKFSADEKPLDDTGIQPVSKSSL